MTAAEWIAKRREHLTAAAAANRRHVSLPFDQREVNHMAVALEALEAALALAKGHRDFVTKRGRDDCICTICDMCRAIESALRGES